LPSRFADHFSHRALDLGDGRRVVDTLNNDVDKRLVGVNGLRHVSSQLYGSWEQPVVAPQRLVTVAVEAAGRVVNRYQTYAIWDNIRQRAQAFDGACAWSSLRFNLAQGGEMQPAFPWPDVYCRR